MNDPIAAVEQRVRVSLDAQQAFDLFTRGIARWWPFRGHSCFDDAAVDVEFEPREGGAVTEVARNGGRMAWGRLTVWDPPRRFAMTWHPGRDAAEATLLTVSFVASTEGTEVQVLHTGWEVRSDAREIRDRYQQGWGEVLQSYEQQAMMRKQG